MNHGDRPRLPTASRRVTLLLLAMLLAINAATVWGIVAARQGARRLAQEDLDWQTRAQARAVEAGLAGLRGDFIFLSQSPPLSAAAAVFDRRDPVARRWGRLDLEGTLLLFVEAHPMVERLAVRDGGGRARVVVGRREGAPVLLPPEAIPELPPGEWVAASWPLGAAGQGTGRLETTVDPRGVLAAAAPGLGDHLAIAVGEADLAGSGGAPAPGVNLVARARVAAPGWDPPIAWTLIRREARSSLVRSVESLAGLFGTAVAANVAVIALTFALAVVAFRQARKTAELAVENEHQARLRELERQVFHSERLASIGRLAAGVAHEVNNPLEGMANYLSALEEDLRAGRTEGTAELAARVREGLGRIAEITRQVLTFAAPGRAPKRAVDLGEVLAQNVAFLDSSQACDGVELAFAPPPAPVLVRGDAITLGQLVLNLLLNAAQAQQGGGRVEVDLARNGERALLTVADHGPGLSEEALAHAFEPFFSTRGSTGLGLAVCRGIVDDHGGSIAAANLPGGGARFTVELPLAAAEATTP
jgi:signal transduction histidine kinase